MNRLVGVGLLVSAFAPMVAVLTILRFHQLGIFAWILLGVCALAVLLLALVLGQVGRIQERSIVPKQVRRCDDRVLAFASSYIVPVAIAAFGKDDAVTLVGAAALVVLLAVIYVRGQMFHLNPTLAVAGYRLYEVTETNETVTMLLTRRTYLAQTETIACRFIGDYVAIQTGNSQ